MASVYIPPPSILILHQPASRWHDARPGMLDAGDVYLFPERQTLWSQDIARLYNDNNYTSCLYQFS